MPKKIRELKAMLRKAGFKCEAGKGSHTNVDTSEREKGSGALRQRRNGRQALSGKGSSRSVGRRAKERLILQYSMLIEWSDEDQVYIVTLPEFGGPKTHGETYEKAARHGREVLELLIDSALEKGEKLPRPAKYRDRVAVST